MMTIPRPRLTVRRLMTVVALAGLVMGGWIEGRRRRERFEAVEQDHLIHLLIATREMPSDWLAWHLSMARKYRAAARSPWLPVWADPPAPALQDSLDRR